MSTGCCSLRTGYCGKRTLINHISFMIERDFLMRQLKQLFAVLQEIIRHRRKGDFIRAVEEIQFFYSSLKIEDDIRSLSIAEMMTILIDKKEFTGEQLELIAFVLKEQGEMERDAAVRRELFGKAFFILSKVEQESMTFSMDRLMKIGELKEYLS